MKIVFIGASTFGLKCLKAAEKLEGCEIAGALTAPRKFPISYRPEGVENVLHADVPTLCKRINVPCFIMENGMNSPSLFKEIRSLQPDIFLVAGWYHMVPRSWRDLAPAYGLHASLLPDYSGGAPLVWAIINGEIRTGITLFQFADGVDNGPIVAQKETSIFDEDTIATLYERIELLGVQLITEYLPRLAAGVVDLTAQNENLRRIFPQRSPEDGRIDWARSSQEIYNFIRAQTKPYPGAFTFWKGEKLTIWKSREINDYAETSGIAGEVIDDQDHFLVQTGSDALEILSLLYNGEEVSGFDFRKKLPPGRAVLSVSSRGAIQQ